MRYAYADPPYLGQCSQYSHYHPEGRCWDDPDTHFDLMLRLTSGEFDGWALSASSPSLGLLLQMAPNDARVGAWVKPFAVFKPNVNPAYAWEPVIYHGARAKRDRAESTVRDWVSVGITLQKGLIGAKPPEFCRWVLDLLGYRHAEDEIVDLFPGTGIMGVVADPENVQDGLFAVVPNERMET